MSANRRYLSGLGRTSPSVNRSLRFFNPHALGGAPVGLGTTPYESDNAATGWRVALRSIRPNTPQGAALACLC
jgi:hypothetical protein